MSDTLFDTIPSLDLADFTSGDYDKKKKFAAQLGEAYNTIGFVAVKGHGLTDHLQAQLYQAVKDFFALPEATKKKYEIASLAGQRGYTSPGRETAKGFSVADLKEFYHVGQERSQMPSDDPLRATYPDNIFPTEIPAFEAHTLAAFRTLENAGKTMLRAIALYLGIEEDYFEDKVAYGNSILRTLHYFPIENPNAVPEGAVRAAAHGDINLITLLMGASAEGLEVLRRDGEWIPITALPDQLVVNVGDMLDRLTNNKLKSTIHRVVNPSREKMGTSRFSIPFFMHPRAEMNLTCLPSCVDEDHPKLYSDMTAGEFLEERLIELGLREK